MKAYRLGNDVNFRWTVTGLDNVSGTKVVQLFNLESALPETITYSISDDVITGKFKGKDQTKAGAYRLILYVNQGENDMVTLDYVDCFELTGVCKFGLQRGDDEPGLETSVVELASDISAPTNYQKPSDGIPASDLDAAVQAALAKALTALQEHQPLKTINGLSIVGSGNIHIEGGEASEESEINGRPEVIITDERNVTLEEGKYYVFGECEELTINIGDQYTDGRLNKYMFEFDSPQDAATRLSLPANLRNVPSFAIVPDSHFVVAIQGNVVSMVGTNSYYPGAGDDDFFKDFFNGDLATIVVPEGVTIIRRYLFYYNRSITNVVLPSTITNIELYAFNNCSGLTNINFPVGLATIGDRAFEGCSSLVGNIVFVGLRSLGPYAFSGCSKITSVTLPEGLTSIGVSAFSGCAGLKSITIPSTLTVFNQNCFATTAITQISIPTGTTILPQSMFSACKQLHTVNIPNTVTLIQATVFAQNTALQRITIPNSVVELQANVFQSCSILTDITLHDSIQTVVQATSMSGIGANATVKIIGTTRVIPFVTLPNTTKVYVDATMVARYKAASGWSGIASRIFSLSDL